MTFKPTYLYIKQHSLTRKLYFGKTTKNDPIRYNGSGTRWVSHLKVHGFEYVVTLWYELFTDQEECTKFALEFSEKMNIVESDQWLNLKPENGLDGGTYGEQLRKLIETASISPNHVSRNSAHSLQKAGNLASLTSPKHNSKDPVHVKRMSDAAIASIYHPSKNIKFQKNWQKAGSLAAVTSSNHISKSIVVCPRCGKEGKGAIMYRWHFDNCKG